MKTSLLSALTLLLLLQSGPAAANIPNFQFVGFAGRGSLANNLSSRLGFTVGSTEHIINIEDCERYRGGEATVTFRVNPLPAGAWQYAVAYAPPGRTCNTNSANPEASAGNCYVPAAQRELTSTTIEFILRFDELMGDDCSAETEGNAKLYLIIEDPTFLSVANQTIDVLVDLRAPVTPTLQSVTGGDRRFTATWQDDTNVSTETSYTVYWDDIPFGDDDIAEVSSRTRINTKSIAIDSNNIENGVTYYVSVGAVDRADNASPISNQLSVVPEETVGFWESYIAAGGNDPGNFCFVATVSYGTHFESRLTTLRAFRDEVLMGSAAGRELVAGYYLYGRFLAAWIADKPALKAVARAVLAPLVWVAWLSLTLGPAGAFGVLLGLLGLLITARRRLGRHLPTHTPRELA